MGHNARNNERDVTSLAAREPARMRVRDPRNASARTHLKGREPRRVAGRLRTFLERAAARISRVLNHARPRESEVRVSFYKREPSARRQPSPIETGREISLSGTCPRNDNGAVNGSSARESASKPLFALLEARSAEGPSRGLR
ncbi:hypothetical protein PUN28_019882 [Cardiocondyla obscurior]|uniref:Uncharacterized protein n=1 Tax=Cardiocondyla obscurior TaxID=286306 RepID=A0AAW2E8P7_9HYME